MSTRLLLGVALAGAMTLAATTAHAVDLRNDDGAEHEIVLSTWKADQGLDTLDTSMKLSPGEVRQGVCAQCIVSLGADEEAESVAAETGQVVVILKGGLLSVE